jgi:uncharacterized protein (UPF0264 family)
VEVKSFIINWEKATGEYSSFEIVRGDIQEEIFERIDYTGNVMHSMDMKLDQMLDKQDQTLQITRDIKEEVVGLRGDTKKHPDDEFGDIRKELVSIKEALARAGIQV